VSQNPPESASTASLASAASLASEFDESTVGELDEVLAPHETAMNPIVSGPMALVKKVDIDSRVMIAAEGLRVIGTPDG